MTETEGRRTTTHILSGLTHEHKSLSVGDDLRSVESLFKVIDELLLVATECFFLRTRDDFASADTFLFKGRQTPSEDGLSDQGDYGRDEQLAREKHKCRLTGDTGFKGGNSSPLASALLSSRVENLIDHMFTIVILEFEDVGGDVDQERVENTLVPVNENIRDLVAGEVETVPEDVVGLSN